MSWANTFPAQGGPAGRVPRSPSRSSSRKQQTAGGVCSRRAGGGAAVHRAPCRGPTCTLPSIPQATLVQQASPAAGSHTAAEYYGEDSDFGWRTSFAQSWACGTVLGQGSFGTVQLAVNLHTGKQAAVKVLPKVRGKLTRERTLEKLAREVDMLERLQGVGGVVTLEDVFEDDDHVMIVTELCSGGDLQHFSETHGGLSERALAHVALEVLKVVRACHTAGMLHGDIKSANFMLKHATHSPLTDPQGDYSSYFTSTTASWLKAIDFGCSQMLPGPGRRLSKRTGTPVYMAPEIYQRDYHVEADMWSVGVMLYQLFARRFPFWEDMETCKSSKLEEVAAAVAHADIRFDYGCWQHMSPAGRAFISACLQRNPEKRLTVEQALVHPWLAQQLFDPHAQQDGAGGVSTASNVLVRAVTARVAAPVTAAA